MKYGISKKSVEKWATKVLEEYKLSEEYAKEQVQIERDFIDYMIYGITPTLVDESFLKDIKTEFLDVDTLIEKYNLTQEEINNLRKL